MTDFRILWRFVFEAEEQPTAQGAARRVADLLAISGLPPVAPYKEPNWWTTDIVVEASDVTLPALFGRLLACAGRLASEWSVHGLAGLEAGESCFAVYNVRERNPPAVAGLRWALVEAWPRD